MTRLRLSEDLGGAMNPINDDLWQAFKRLAETYPDDDGVRMTVDLARWLEEERQRVAAAEIAPPD
jgi:hypothetical protein